MLAKKPTPLLLMSIRLALSSGKLLPVKYPGVMTCPIKLLQLLQLVVDLDYLTMHRAVLPV